MAVTLPSGGRFAGGVEVPVREPELTDGWSGLWSAGDCGCGGAALEDGWSGMWPASSSSSSSAFVGGCGCERPALDDGWSGSPTARTSSGARGEQARRKGCGSKLSADPGPDGIVDPEDQAAIDELNDQLDNEPGETPDREAISAAHAGVYEEVAGLFASLDAPSPIGQCPQRGTETTCPSPPVLAHSLCTIDGLPVVEARAAYQLSADASLEPLDPDVVLLLDAAWAFLYTNLDLVSWLACIVSGEDNAGQDDLFGNLVDAVVEVFTGGIGDYRTLAECLTEKVLGIGAFPLFGGRVNIHLEERERRSGASFHTIRGLGSGTIRIYPGYDWSERYVGGFVNGSDEERFCVTADLAATLLHELVHTCLAGASADNDEPCACELTFLIENSLRWAWSQRYPCLTATDGCAFYADQNTWMNSCVAYVDRPPDSDG